MDIFFLYPCSHCIPRDSHQLVISELWVICIRNIFHVNFMARQWNLVVVLLNGPSGNTLFRFLVGIENVFSYICRIKISRPIPVNVAQRKFGLDEWVFVGPEHAELGTIFFAIQKKCATPPQKHGKSGNAAPGVFAVLVHS